MESEVVIGGLISIIGTIIGAIITVSRLLWVRLFSDTDPAKPNSGGYVTKLVESHLDLNESMKESIKAERALLMELKVINQQQLQQGESLGTKHDRLVAATCEIYKAGKVLSALLPDDTIRTNVMASLDQACAYLEGRKSPEKP